MNIPKIFSATNFLYGIGGIFAGVLAYQAITNRPLDTVIVGVITSIIGFAVHANGNQQGVNNTNDVVAKTAKAQFPLSNGGKENAGQTPQP